MVSGNGMMSLSDFTIVQGQSADNSQIRANHRTARACFIIKCESIEAAGILQDLLLGAKIEPAGKRWASIQMSLHYSSGAQVKMRTMGASGRGHPDELVLLEPSGSNKSAVSTSNGWFVLDSRAEKPKKGKDNREVTPPHPPPPPQTRGGSTRRALGTGGGGGGEGGGRGKVCRWLDK